MADNGRLKKCKYCGRIDNLVKSGKKYLSVCADHKNLYDKDRLIYLQKQKKCLICGTKNNLIKIGKNIYNSCEEHYEQYKNMIHNKKKKTLVKNYGVENPMYDKNIVEKNHKTYKYRYWDIFLIKLKQKQIEPLFNKKYFINNFSTFEYKCLRCGNVFISDNTNEQHVFCGCKNWRSNYEDEIITWIKSVNPNIQVIKNKRFSFINTTRECDIYLPEYNLGIDFHGLYWHSNIEKNRSYHQEKWKLFKNIEINIIQIFESEWVNKKEIVKSIILSKLSIYKDKIYARNTKIENISNEQYKIFLEQNHIQGHALSKFKMGLFYNNELVSVIGIGRSRFKNNEWEVIRFCNKLNTVVVGGFSKLLNYIDKNCQFDNLISFIDLRYFDGVGYIKNGFKIKSITNPNYYYFIKNYFDKNNFTLYSRIQFQKHKLKNKLENFDSNLTEYQNMLNNNYLRIFDAGNYKLIYSR